MQKLYQQCDVQSPGRCIALTVRIDVIPNVCSKFGRDITLCAKIQQYVIKTKLLSNYYYCYYTYNCVHTYLANKQIVLFTSLFHYKGQFFSKVLVTFLMLVTYIYVVYIIMHTYMLHTYNCPTGNVLFIVLIKPLSLAIFIKGHQTI